MDNRVIMPDKNIVEQFHRVTKAFFETKHSIEEQIKTLIQLRDSLLPKLMKGEIPIPA